MLKDLAPLLILLLAILPGTVADRLYRTIIGVHWQEKEWQMVLRLLMFSIVGAGLYSIVANYFGGPQLTYLFPSSYTSGAITPNTLHLAFAAYAGHFLGATLVGLFIVAANKLLAPWVTTYPGGWDTFVRDCVKGHFVVVALENTQAYAGYIKSADASVAKSERDLILQEPALYQNGQYIALPYQYLFLPASLVSSIGVIYDNALDGNRLTQIGMPVFAQGENYGSRQTFTTITTTDALPAGLETVDTPSST